MQGGFVDQHRPGDASQLFATASLSFGIGDAQVTYGSATGLIVIRTGLDGANAGVAGMLSVSRSAGVGLPNIGSLFSVRARSR